MLRAMGTQVIPASAYQVKIVGSCAWARAGGPPMTFAQKAHQLAGSLVELFRETPGDLRWWASKRGLMSARPVEKLELLELPETPIVKAAEQTLLQTSTGAQSMVGHSYRCFHFAHLMYQLSGCEEPLDTEVLALITLLHDVGLFPQMIKERDENEFTVRSAAIAADLCKQCGFDQERTALTELGITLNANARVPLAKWGPEAHFARLAPVMDGLGQVWKLHPENAAEIFSLYPLDGLQELVPRLVIEEAERQPGGRFSLYRPFFGPMVRARAGRWRRFEAS